MADEFDNESAQSCPYCGSSDSCEHLLLYVDSTFRNAEGGGLMEAFNSRWSDIVARYGPDCDERVLFDELLEEVESLADDFVEYDFEGGPGMSSSYTLYFSSSKGRLNEVLGEFRTTLEDEDSI